MRTDFIFKPAACGNLRAAPLRRGQKMILGAERPCMDFETGGMGVFDHGGRTAQSAIGTARDEQLFERPDPGGITRYFLQARRCQKRSVGLWLAREQGVVGRVMRVDQLDEGECQPRSGQYLPP